MRFWGQFREMVDKYNMAGVTKNPFVKEFLALNVRKLIDGLPFIADGYNRAKSLLGDRYGKESEVVKTYLKDILDLPSIDGCNTKKIHEFYEKLLLNVQSLETYGKLKQVDGYVAIVLDTIRHQRRLGETRRRMGKVGLYQTMRSLTNVDTEK